MSDDRWSKENIDKSNETVKQKYPRLRPQVFQKFVSKKAHGTPPTAEALFILIRDGKSDTGAFKWLRRLYTRFNDEQLWEMYDSWNDGNLHPLLLQQQPPDAAAY